MDLKAQQVGDFLSQDDVDTNLRMCFFPGRGNDVDIEAHNEDTEEIGDQIVQIAFELHDKFDGAKRRPLSLKGPRMVN